MPHPTPLNVLIHIPKTAGTSVNHALRAGGRGKAHIEQILAKPQKLTKTLARSDWVSGHVPYPTMRAALETATDRPLRFYSMLRDPVDQLASHYNWWHVVYHRGPHSFWRQGRYFRDLSRQIRAIDTTNPKAIIALLQEHHALFLNMQAKYLLNAAPNWTTKAINARLDEFELVALNDRLDYLLGALHLSTARKPRRQNVSPYYFDPEIFRHGAVAEFLHQNHAMDFALFDAVVARAQF